MNLKHREDQLTFQGKRKNCRYFEGWYFKQVSWDCQNMISIIPGLSKDTVDPHSFIQVITLLRGLNGYESPETQYYKYPIDDFKYRDNPFRLVIGNNLFDNKGIILDLQNDNYKIQGNIAFSKFTKIHRNLASPNAMGYFAYLNFMECYHDIISMDHGLKGELLINQKSIDLNGGRGYIEKDWGKSFPSEYIWLQSNHFSGVGTSIMFSFARIPFLGTEFKGFICNLTLNGREFRFATYNNSKIIRADFSKDLMEFAIVKGKYELIIKARISADLGALKAPSNGIMNRKIKEGLTGNVDIRMLKNSQVLFTGCGDPCAIEVVR